ncbi:thioredoxin family protein [Marinirhabdus gelatinilytica]|uniref:Thioredoxin-like protein n=1 Tax=Marinirhabdus gelatinilytica TaxID=1703343 RepID=A0A370QAM1_9FLAO|nr:thioredoxin family protein [Marinirhabdus gelatinilytica]RDK85424.1 thioredoxin-like protein [Marinirhabdus gelatinilytica]
MKKALILCLLLVTGVAFAQNEADSTLKWLTNLEKAQKIAKKKNKPILVYFTGSDWCAPCKKLKQDFFESEKFVSQAENMVLVIIDRPRRMDIISEEQLAYNKTVIAKYNKENTFPKLVMLNAKGKKKGEISGYSQLRDTSHHFAFLEKYSR